MDGPADLVVGRRERNLERIFIALALLSLTLFTIAGAAPAYALSNTGRDSLSSLQPAVIGTAVGSSRPSGGPPARAGAAMTYDAADGYTVLFGGNNGAESLQDTWILQNGQWSELHPTVSPPARFGAGMAYDAADGYVVLFGGFGCAETCGETWIFKAGQWTELTPATLPPIRGYPAMEYDAADGYVVLFGGTYDEDERYLQDTWVFKGGEWSQLFPSSPPSPRGGASLAYDATDGYLVMFGGTSDFHCICGLADTWKFAAGQWTRLAPTSSPNTRYGYGLTYDPATDAVILFGGWNANGGCGNTTRDMWEFAGGSWTELAPDGSPSTREGAALDYDPDAGGLLLFGGSNGTCGEPGTYYSDTWEFSDGAWSEVAAEGSPEGTGEGVGGTPEGTGEGKPVNTEPPELSGKAEVGATLTCSTGGWTGAPAPTFTYQWLRDGISIPGAGASTYRILAEDLGETISCDVTATNGAGSSASDSNGMLVSCSGACGIPPTNIVAPQISGMAELGATLTCSPGVWAGEPAPAFTYRWLREGVPIEGATENTYKVVAEDLSQALACKVTATNSAGSREAVSNAISHLGSAPVSIEAPKALGRAEVGETLSCTPGSWEGVPAPTFTYQWLRDDADIPAATKATYTVSGADQARSLSCRVTATNSEGSAEASSSNSIAIPGSAPLEVHMPEVTGPAEVGETLTCSSGSWVAVPAATFAYQWLRDGSPIPTATMTTYKIVGEDAGHSLSCTVTATNAEGSGEASSINDVYVPGSVPVNIEPPQLTGAATVGEALSCSPGAWQGAPAPVLTYRWLRDGTVIFAAVKSTYVVTSEDEGQTLSCEVTATNAEGGATVTSSSVSIPGAEPEDGTSLIPTSTAAGGGASPEPIPAPETVTTPTQVLAALTAQLGPQLPKLRERMSLEVAFASPIPGTLELAWSETPKGAHGAARAARVLVASSSVRFGNASSKTLRLHLTRAGRRLMKDRRRIALTAEAVFRGAGSLSVTWLKPFVLTP